MATFQVTETKMKINAYVVNLLLLLLFFSFNFWRIRGFQKWRNIGSRLIICVYHSLSSLLDNILLNYINLKMNVEFLCDRCCRHFVNVNLFNLYNKTWGIGITTISYYQWWNKGTKKLNNLSKAIQPISWIAAFKPR